MMYGYTRVSTKGQAKDGNSLEAQKSALVERGCSPDNIFTDSFTGTKASRPGLDKLLAVVHSGDTIMVTKLDRLARSARQGMELIEGLLAAGVNVDILNMGRMDSTPTGRLIRNVMLAFAEFERDCIVARTTEGKEIAREKPGYREGRKPINVDMEHFFELVVEVLQGIRTKTAAAKELGVSRAKFYQLLEQEVA